MGKVGKVYSGEIDWLGNSINSEDNSYYEEIIKLNCGNDHCANTIDSTQYEIDSNLNEEYCTDCLQRYGDSDSESINLLQIFNDVNGVNKCLNNLKHDISILSPLGCFKCSIAHIESLKAKQKDYNKQREEDLNNANNTMNNVSPTFKGDILFRSKAESEIYTKLKAFDENLVYEMLYARIYIDGEPMYYSPDFYLPEYNLFVEFRGYDANYSKIANLHWKKSFRFGDRIKSGLKEPSKWGTQETLKNEEFCKYVIIANKGIYFFEKGKEKKFLKKEKCSKCKLSSVKLGIFDMKCYLCGE